MLEKLDGSARRALADAARQTSALGHARTGTEHLLLGLLREEEDGEISRVLRELGVSVRHCREAVLGAVERGEPLSARHLPPLTAEAQRALGQAPDEARALGAETVRAEHLLLALLRHRDALSARLLQRVGVEYAGVKQHLARQPHVSQAVTSAASPAPLASAVPASSEGCGPIPRAQSGAHELEVEVALRLVRRLASLSRVITLEVCERDGAAKGMRVSCQPQPGEHVLHEILLLEDDGLRVLLDSGGVVRFAAS